MINMPGLLPQSVEIGRERKYNPIIVGINEKNVGDNVIPIRNNSSPMINLIRLNMVLL